MIDPNVVKTIGDLGVPTFVLALFLVFVGFLVIKTLTWYTGETKRHDEVVAKMQTEIVAVVANNTAAITRLCDSTSETASSLEQHDVRAQRIEATVNAVAKTADSIERKVDALKPGQLDPVRLSRKATQ